MLSSNLSRVSKGLWEDFSSSIRLIVSIFLMLTVGITVLGNGFVIFAFKVDRKLKKHSNLLLLNLAIGDFLVGAISLPIYITYVLNGKWILGRGLCKLWLAIDYAACWSSVLSLVLVSHDRFLSVTDAFAYRAQQGITKQAFIKMLTVWILAVLIYAPAVSCWDIIVGFSVIPDGQCTPEFLYNRYFRFFACSIDFFVPFTIIIYFNFNIYFTISKHKKSKTSNVDKTQMQTRDEESTAGIFYVKTDGVEVYKASYSDTEAQQIESSSILCENSNVKVTNSQLFPAQNKGDCHDFLKTSGEMCTIANNNTTSQSSKLSRDMKMAKSLLLIITIFCICWSPLSLLVIIREFCNLKCIQPVWYEIATCFLRLNSSINPFLYPLCYPAFKNIFKNFICYRQFHCY